MTISSLLLFSQSFNNSLSQLLTSPFTSLRKFPNFPPTIKSTTYSPSYLHHRSSLCYRRSSAPAQFKIQLLCLDSNPPPVTFSRFHSCTQLLSSSLNPLYWIISIQSGMPVTAPHPRGGLRGEREKKGGREGENKLFFHCFLNWLYQCFSNSSVYLNHLEGLLKYTLLSPCRISVLIGLTWGLRILTSTKFPGAAADHGPHSEHLVYADCLHLLHLVCSSSSCK